MSFFHPFCHPTLHSGLYAVSKTWKCCFFNVKLMIFIHRGVRLARYGAVSEGLAGPYWPSQTTSKPPLDLQKIVTNLIIFAHPAPSGPSCRSKGTHKCLDIRFQAKTQLFHPCLSKTHICGGQCTSFFKLFLHFRVQTCIKNCIRLKFFVGFL